MSETKINKSTENIIWIFIFIVIMACWYIGMGHILNRPSSEPRTYLCQYKDWQKIAMLKEVVESDVTICADVCSDTTWNNCQMKCFDRELCSEVK